jgi:hypothetical protein
MPRCGCGRTHMGQLGQCSLLRRAGRGASGSRSRCKYTGRRAGRVNAPLTVQNCSVCVLSHAAKPARCKHELAVTRAQRVCGVCTPHLVEDAVDTVPKKLRHNLRRALERYGVLCRLRDQGAHRSETLAAAERAHASLMLRMRRARRRSQTSWLALPV